MLLGNSCALSRSETITRAPVGASVANRRQPKSMGLVLMTRQEPLNASLLPSLLGAGAGDDETPAAHETDAAGPVSSVEWNG